MSVVDEGIHWGVVPETHTILLVEDNPLNIHVSRRILETAGFVTLVAEDGESCLQQVASITPDLILLDVIMPGIDGFETCRRLKASEQSQDIPIIFMTGLSDTIDKVKAFELGAVDYITKPIQAAEMLARIHTHLTLRNLQKGLQQQIAEREQLIAELDAFAHTVAHDLKGPLSIMIGFAEILQSQQDLLASEDKQTSLRAIVQTGFKMRNIIDGLLLLAGVRQQDVLMEPLDTSDIVAEARHRLLFMAEQAHASINAPDTWPVALGYAAWVEEVWFNYLSNALKYGGRPPQITLGWDAQPDGMIRFWVRDNGRGLTPDEQAQLFTPFTRINQAATKGHGLGLSIVRRITNRLGGDVGVESQVGAGSTFYFTLPAPSNPSGG